MSDAEQLGKIRDRIDAIDEQVHQLLNQRAEAAMEVARIKLSADPNAVFYRPEREAQVLRMVQERNQGPLDDEEVARLFREIMSACLALERPLKVAYLGPEGTFTQAAAWKHFGHAMEALPVVSIPDIFREVEAGNCQYGVVPIENSTEGVVTHTLDTFVTSPLNICGEVMLRIHHNLLSQAQTLDSISKVYSHQQSLAQCRGWLDRNLPKAERVAVASNAEAARLAAAARRQALERVTALNRLLRTRLQQRRAPEPVILSPATASPYILCVAFPGFEGAVMTRLLDCHGVVVGAGSACSAAATAPSHVLNAMRTAPETARSVLRISLSENSSAADVDAFFEALDVVLAEY